MTAVPRTPDSDDERALVALLTRCGAHDLAAVHALAADVAARYREPHRHYHTLAHAASVAQRVTALAAAAHIRDTRALLLAAWLHDVIYDTHSDSNEHDSARYAIDRLAPLGIDVAVIAAAARLIRATADHVATGREDTVLLEADLAILAAPYFTYRKYARQIREEYSWVPEADFRRERVEILERLLRQRPFTSAGTVGWWVRAKVNIAREITELSRPARRTR